MGVGDFFSQINPIRAIRDAYRWREFKKALKQDTNVKLEYRARPAEGCKEPEDHCDEAGALPLEMEDKYLGCSAYAKVNRLKRGVNQCNDRFKRIRELERELESARSEVEGYESKIVSFTKRLASIEKNLNEGATALIQKITADNIQVFYMKCVGKNYGMEQLEEFRSLLDKLLKYKDRRAKKIKEIERKLSEFFPDKSFNIDGNEGAWIAAKTRLERQRVCVQLAEREMRYELICIYREWRMTGKIRYVGRIYCPTMLISSDWPDKVFPDFPEEGEDGREYRTKSLAKVIEIMDDHIRDVGRGQSESKQTFSPQWFLRALDQRFAKKRIPPRGDSSASIEKESHIDEHPNNKLVESQKKERKKDGGEPENRIKPMPLIRQAPMQRLFDNEENLLKIAVESRPCRLRSPITGLPIAATRAANQPRHFVSGAYDHTTGHLGAVRKYEVPHHPSVARSAQKCLLEGGGFNRVLFC